MSGLLVIIGKGNTRGQGRVIARNGNAQAVWGINNVERYPELTMLWEMHPWPAIRKYNPVNIDMLPVMMQEKYIDLPHSKRYPLEQMEEIYGGIYANNTLAYMLMLAIASKLSRGDRRFSTIYLAGIDYRSPDRAEIEFERACTEYWIGYALARGINVYWPEESNLMTFPGYVPGIRYGYDKAAPELVRQARENYSQVCAEVLLETYGTNKQKEDHDHDKYCEYIKGCVKRWKK